MDTFYSRYAGAIKIKNNILIDSQLNPILLQSVFSCYRTGEIPLLNNKPISNLHKLINNILENIKIC